MFIKSLLAVCIIIFTAGKPQPRITWVAIGDSITYLNDHPDETGNRVQKGYMTRVVEQLPQLEYRNQGHNGWTSGGIAEKFDALKIDTGAVYTIFLGTNDWWQGRPVGTIEDYKSNRDNKTICSSFGIIISKIRQINPHAIIVLMTPLQRMDFVYLFDAKNNAYGSYKPKNGQTLEQVANAIRAIGELEKIPVVDLYHDPALSIENAVHFKRLKNPETGKYTNYKYPASNSIPHGAAGDEYPYPPAAVNMTYDGLHPSDKGNARIAELLLPVLSRSPQHSNP